MKKIIKIIVGLLLILSVKKVKASYVMSEWSIEYPSNVPKDVIRIEKRYRWYREEEVNIEYLIKEKINGKLVDYNDVKYVTNEFITKPKEYEERKISSETLSKINHFYLYNFNINSELKLSEIKVYDKDTLKQIVINCDSDYNYLINGNTKDYKLILSTDKIYLSLKADYDIDGIIVELYYISSGDNSFTFGFYNGLKNQLYYQNSNIKKCDSSCLLNYNNKNVIYDFDSSTIYKYTDKLYKTYEIKRNYLDGYYFYANGYIKDDSTETLYYSYPEYEEFLLNSDDEIVTDYEKECILGKYFCHYGYEKIIYDAVVEEEIKEIIPIEEENNINDEINIKEKQSKEIIPPKTLDNFNINKITILILSVIIIWIYYFKKIVKKGRMIFSSNFVE